MQAHYADRMSGVKPSAIRSLITNPDMIFFGGGYPDAKLFPVEAIEKAYTRVLRTSGSDALQYSSSIGLTSLREHVRQKMALDQTSCQLEEIMIVQGAQQGLDLVARLLINKDDVIAVEAPTFLGALGAFATCEPQYLSIPLDHEGINTSLLAHELESKRIKLLYTIPDFHNPTGVTMSLERRRELLRLADKFDFIILEDTPYRDVYFDNPPPPTLKSMDTSGRVIYLGSFSKILSPGLRLGWIVANEELVQKLTLLKLGSDTQSSTINMAVVSSLFEDFDLDDHIGKLREHYRAKKTSMIQALKENLGGDIHFTDPRGGLFTWLTFPTNFNAKAFLIDKAIPKFNVGYVPGDAFFAEAPELNHARMSFSTLSAEDIMKGIRALAAALNS
ncbi:PLP-dependent aminotransferase family protein [Brucella pituitosa]|uniref:aminotransferase-like domain-containing protein n=1 Tax=Brucella pituitosa TaxID=571256 RepID=UPI000F5FE6C5|nr:PLP-dependent aminotransferase family protein [Brucellaceae bacterium VT-16-1752]